MFVMIIWQTCYLLDIRTQKILFACEKNVFVHGNLTRRFWFGVGLNVFSSQEYNYIFCNFACMNSHGSDDFQEIRTDDDIDFEAK